ncbi:MAG: hypothetical protein II921_05815 [Treponema sp.]|nr:hypothetical protein [Treponema sp.]
MKKLVRLFASTLALFVVSTAFASAEMVKSLDFTAVTRTEKVVIGIDSKQQTMEYLTPSRDYKYVILDSDYEVDPNTGSSVFKGTVLDTKYNTASEVVIYSNDKFADMRIGKRQITFTYVQEFDVKE